MATLEEQKKLLVPFLQVWPPPPLLPGSGCCCSHRRCRVCAALSPHIRSCSICYQKLPDSYCRQPACSPLNDAPPCGTAASPVFPPHLCRAVLQRAQEIERAEPKVAYYCRMYALEQVGVQQGLNMNHKLAEPKVAYYCRMSVLEQVRGQQRFDYSRKLAERKVAYYCRMYALEQVRNSRVKNSRVGRGGKRAEYAQRLSGQSPGRPTTAEPSAICSPWCCGCGAWTFPRPHALQKSPACFIKCGFFLPFSTAGPGNAQDHARPRDHRPAGSADGQAGEGPGSSHGKAIRLDQYSQLEFCS